MNHLLYFIGGNPNTESDFEVLKSEFQSQGVNVGQFPQLQYSSLEKVYDIILDDIKNYQQVSFVAYSYGSYLLAKLLESHQIEKRINCIFIAPYWKSPEGVSLVVRGLLSSPIIGKKLLEKIATNKPKDFVENVFYPEKPNNFNTEGLDKELSNFQLWKQAIRSKQLQYCNPLGLSLRSKPVRAVAIEGQSDKVSNWQEQNKTVQSLLPELEIIKIENQGHALPWTQKKLIAKTINQLLGE